MAEQINKRAQLVGLEAPHGMDVDSEGHALSGLNKILLQAELRPEDGATPRPPSLVPRLWMRNAIMLTLRVMHRLAEQNLCGLSFGRDGASHEADIVCAPASGCASCH